MAKKRIVLGQDKNYKGKIPTKEIKRIINKLKTRYHEHSDDSTQIIGFEINGGTGLTKTGTEEMQKFQKWAREKGMDAEYNSKSDLEKITTELRNRILGRKD